MEDSVKYAVIVAVIGLLLFMYCRQQKKEKMVVSAPNVMPNTNMVMPAAKTSGLQPADTDTVDYGAYPSSAQPCATAVPYS